MYTNLLTETINVLDNYNLSLDDIHFVSDGIHSCDKSTFSKMAGKCNYNSGYGLTEINDDLVVVGDNWWLERHDYDGSEWWEFKRLPECTPSGNVVLKLGDN